MKKVSCVMCVRNDEQYLGEVLNSLRSQSYPLHEIILVNDGSTDHSVDIAKNFGVHILNLPCHEFSVAGTPFLAKRFNVGLKVVDGSDYVLIVGSDDVFPPDYVASVIGRMEFDANLVIASGQAKNEPSNPNVPRGAGRLVKTWFWNQINGLSFPLLWCWEEYFVYRALQLNFKVKGFEDILFERKRLEKRTKTKLMGDGKSMYALGYSWQFVFVKFVSEFLKSPRDAVYVFCGWLCGCINKFDRAEDLRSWLTVTQNYRLTKMFRRLKNDM